MEVDLAKKLQLKLLQLLITYTKKLLHGFFNIFSYILSN